MFTFFEKVKDTAKTVSNNLAAVLKYAATNPKIAACLAVCVVTNFMAKHAIACTTVYCEYTFREGNKAGELFLFNNPAANLTQYCESVNPSPNRCVLTKVDSMDLMPLYCDPTPPCVQLCPR